MKGIRFVILFITIFIFSSFAFAENPDAIVGQWYPPGGRAAIEIYECEQSYCGKVVWIDEPIEKAREKVDSLNPDPALRDRKILGLNILSGFHYKGENRWGDGKIYNPRNGKTYSCRMTLEGDTLKVRGYVGISLIGKTTEWMRRP